MSITSLTFWVGLDVHKDSVTAAGFRNRDPESMRVDRIPNDPRKLRRYFERLEAEGQVRACYEASGAGYVLQRALADWGVPCELAAPSLMPTLPGEHRKADRRDAIKGARFGERFIVEDASAAPVGCSLLDRPFHINVPALPNPGSSARLVPRTRRDEPEGCSGGA